MKTTAIIQARMGSTRLPGKTLLPLAGKTVLQHVIERTMRAQTIDDVIVAIPDDNGRSDIIKYLVEQIRWPKPIKVEQPAGIDENDVLSRVKRAACHAGELHKLLVEITADCPLICWQEIDRLVLMNKAASNYLAYTTNAHPKGFCDVDGLDVQVYSTMVLGALERRMSSKEREHVGSYIPMNPGMFGDVKWIGEQQEQGCANPFNTWRWTLDTQGDYNWLCQLPIEAWDKPSSWLKNWLINHPDMIRTQEDYDG